MCLIVASASFSGFFSRYAFNDIELSYGDYSLTSMVNGETIKPYIYRQLIPYTSDTIASNLSPNLQKKITSWIMKPRFKGNNNFIHNTYAQATDSNDPDTIITYYLVYFFSFISLFFSIIIFRQISIHAGIDSISATLGSFAFALILPYFLNKGAFFYDLSELFFMGLSVLLAVRKRYLMLILLVGFATFNKEAFLAFSLTLAPFLIKDLGWKKGLFLQSILLAICGLVSQFTKAIYSNNLGGSVDWHLFDHVQSLFTLSTYFQYDFTYGLIAPQGYNILTIVLITIVTRISYPQLPQLFKQHLYMALAINLPLFILFCQSGELRNLSFLFISLNILIAIYISSIVKRNY